MRKERKFQASYVFWIPCAVCKEFIAGKIDPLLEYLLLNPVLGVCGARNCAKTVQEEPNFVASMVGLLILVNITTIVLLKR